MIEVAQHGRAHRVKCAHHLHALGHHLLRLLPGRSLGHTQEAGRPARHGRSHGNRRIDQDLAGLERVLQVREVLRLRPDGHREQDDLPAPRGIGVLEPVHLRAGNPLARPLGGLLRPLGAAGPDHHRHPLARQSKRQPEPERARSAHDRYGGRGGHGANLARR